VGQMYESQWGNHRELHDSDDDTGIFHESRPPGTQPRGGRGLSDQGFIAGAASGPHISFVL